MNTLSKVIILILWAIILGIVTGVLKINFLPSDSIWTHVICGGIAGGGLVLGFIFVTKTDKQ